MESGRPLTAAVLSGRQGGLSAAQSRSLWSKRPGAVCIKLNTRSMKFKRKRRPRFRVACRLDARCGIFAAPGRVQSSTASDSSAAACWGEPRRAGHLLSRETWSILYRLHRGMSPSLDSFGSFDDFTARTLRLAR